MDYDPIRGFNHPEPVPSLATVVYIAPNSVEDIRSAAPRPGAGPGNSTVGAFLDAPYVRRQVTRAAAVRPMIVIATEERWKHPNRDPNTTGC